MNAHNRWVLLSIGSALLISACSPQLEPLVEPSEPYLEPQSIVPEAELAAVIEIYSHRIDYTPASSVTVTQAEAQFLAPPVDGRPSRVLVSGGEVYHNDVQIPDVSSSVIYELAYEADDSAITVDGRMNRFRVTGSDRFPAFIDSVRSPTGATTILFPSTLDTIDRTHELTVRWDGAGADTAYIRVHTEDRWLTRLVPDRGNYTFTAAELAPFAAGPIEVEVTRFNYRKHSLAGEGSLPRYALLFAQSQHTTQTVLR